ncbi:MAG: hypothetical protein FK731_11220 [Asgard group archaeon]|nr:hypothetical protein [Asgard group archaeon]
MSNNTNKESDEEKGTKKDYKKILYVVLILVILGIVVVTFYFGISLIIVGMPVAVFGGLILSAGIIPLILLIFLIWLFIKNIKIGLKQNE